MSKMGKQHTMPCYHAQRLHWLRKLRKTAAVDHDGNIISSHPCRPSPAFNNPPGWNQWSAAEKVEHLLGLSLDRMHDYLPWPADSLNPYRLAAQTQVVRVIAMLAAKVGGEAARERDRERSLGEFMDEFEQHAARRA